MNNNKTLLDYLNEMDRFAAHSGIQLVEIREGYAKAQMRVEEHHLNGGGVCQGGALFTLGDLTFAGAANSHGKLCLGINCQIHFVSSALLGDTLTAECHEQSSRKIPLLEAKIFNQEGRLIALMTGECYKKEEEFSYSSLM